MSFKFRAAASVAPLAAAVAAINVPSFSDSHPFVLAAASADTGARFGTSAPSAASAHVMP